MAVKLWNKGGDRLANTPNAGAMKGSYHALYIRRLCGCILDLCRQQPVLACGPNFCIENFRKASPFIEWASLLLS
jgi:hypothetical protein